jgi:hypothetical protein
MGEFDVTRVGLAMFHQLDWLVVRGVNLAVRYDWEELEPDPIAVQRFAFEARVHPYTYVELIGQYRLGVSPEVRHEALFQIHGWY